MPDSSNHWNYITSKPVRLKYCSSHNPITFSSYFQISCLCGSKWGVTSVKQLFQDTPSEVLKPASSIGWPFSNLWDPGWIYHSVQRNSQLIFRTYQVSNISSKRPKGENIHITAQKFQISASLSTLRFLHTLCRWHEWQSGINNWECHRHPQKATRHWRSTREVLTAPKGTALFHNPYLTVINFEASYLPLWHFRTTPSSENATPGAYQRKM